MERFSFQATGFEVSACEHTQNTTSIFSPSKFLQNSAKPPSDFQRASA